MPEWSEFPASDTVSILLWTVLVYLFWNTPVNPRQFPSFPGFNSPFGIAELNPALVSMDVKIATTQDAHLKVLDSNTVFKFTMRR